jgi:predicted RNA-binding Zn ribbon-like protein
MQAEARETPFLFVANWLCLDFINTEIITQGQRVSLIRNTVELEAWLADAGVADATRLEALEASCKEEKAQIVGQALELRATLRVMVEQITAGLPVSDPVIATINNWLAQRKGYRILRRTEDGYAMTVCYEESAGELLAPIAESAAELLAHADLRLVHKCENPQCILYFYDTSKNHARRWCSMDLCGNRKKVAAHYRRHRHTATESTRP